MSKDEVTWITIDADTASLRFKLPDNEDVEILNFGKPRVGFWKRYWERLGNIFSRRVKW